MRLADVELKEAASAWGILVSAMLAIDAGWDEDDFKSGAEIAYRQMLAKRQARNAEAGADGAPESAGAHKSSSSELLDSAALDQVRQQLAEAQGEIERLQGRTHDAIGYSDAYYLEMAALDNYPVEDGLLKSTSVVFRIHQLGRAREAAEAALAEAEKDLAEGRGMFNAVREQRDEIQATLEEAEQEREHWHSHYDAALFNWKETAKRYEALIAEHAALCTALAALVEQWRSEVPMVGPLASVEPKTNGEWRRMGRCDELARCADDLAALLRETEA